MSEWKETTIGEIAEVIGGGTPKTSVQEYWEGNIPWLTPRDLTSYYRVQISKGDRSITEEGLKNSSARLLPKGSVLLTSRAPIGYVAIAANEICTNQGFKSLIPKDGISDSFFLYYWLKCNTDYLQANGTGTTFSEISGSVVKQLEISLPPLPEQRAIASVLSCLDDKIDLLHRQNKTLEQMAETLFREWFVEAIQKIEFEGNLVEGFQLDKFTKWIEGTLGGEWGKENPQGDYTKQVYCIRGTDIADLNTGLPLKIPRRYVKENKFEKIKSEDGDLIIEISGGTETQSTGRITYINSDVENLFDLPLVFSNFCRMIKVKKPKYSFFIYCYIQYLYNQDEFFNLENGSSGIKNLDYKALLLELDYPMPEEEMVLKFHEAVQPFFKKLNKNKTQIRTLTALRDTLLPKLMSGEVRVNNDIKQS